jgi:hypothetical protein
MEICSSCFSSSQELSSGGEFLDNMLLNSLDDVLLAFSLAGLGLVDVGLLVAPGLLVSKSFFAVFFLKGVHFKELLSGLDGLLVL